MKNQDQIAPLHQTKKVIIIENNSNTQKNGVFQPNQNKLNNAAPKQQGNILPPQVLDVLQQFVQENKSENINITQRLAEQSRFDPFNKQYLKQMGMMLENNQKKLYELQTSVVNLRDRVELVEEKMSEIEQQLKFGEQRKKKNRRTAAEIEKQFKCPYENCERFYGSEVSMNLHIKIKHNGGSKTDRERAAKMLIDGISDSQELSINLPPQLLESIKQQINQEKVDKQLQL